MAVSILIVLGAALAGLAVMFGAFGAHGLEGRLDARAFANWQTATQYQFLHALALLLLAALWSRLEPVWGLAAATAFLVGVLLFSGSLYALALGAPRGVAVLAPTGGVLFLVGWAATAVAAVR